MLLCKSPFSNISTLQLTFINRNQDQNRFIVKSVPYWRLQHERVMLKRFQSKTPFIRAMLDEIVEPADPPAIVLKHLDDDLMHASFKKRLSRLEVKYVAKRVLEALKVLHQDGFVHTGTAIPHHIHLRAICTDFNEHDRYQAREYPS